MFDKFCHVESHFTTNEKFQNTWVTIALSNLLTVIKAIRSDVLFFRRFVFIFQRLFTTINFFSEFFFHSIQWILSFYFVTEIALWLDMKRDFLMYRFFKLAFKLTHCYNIGDLFIEWWCFMRIVLLFKRSILLSITQMICTTSDSSKLYKFQTFIFIFSKCHFSLSCFYL